MPAWVGSVVGSRSVRFDGVPAAIRQRELAAEQQQAAAAAIHELANQFLLAGSEIAGFDRPDDQPLVGEQVFRAGRKAIGQLFGIGDALAVDLVFAGANHGGDLHHAVVLFGLADKLVLPARLTLDVQDAARLGADIHQAGYGIVGRVLLAGERSSRDLERSGAGAADIEHQSLGLQVAVRPQGDGARSQELCLARVVASHRGAHRQVDLVAGVSALMQGDLGGEAGVGQGARGNRDIVQLDVVCGALASEAHGVNGNVARAQRAHRVRVDASSVVVAVAEQHHGADRQVGRLFAQLFEAVADAGRGRVGFQVVEAVDAGGHGIDAVKTRLKRTVQAGEDAVLKRLHGLCLAGGTVLG